MPVWVILKASEDVLAVIVAVAAETLPVKDIEDDHEGAAVKPLEINTLPVATAPNLANDVVVSA